MKTRFDLEQEIMQCWNVTDDIKAIYTYHLDKQALTEDEMGNILIGLEKLYQIKFETLFDTFEQCLKQKEFNKDEFVESVRRAFENEQPTTRENEDRYATGFYELGN